MPPPLTSDGNIERHVAEIWAATLGLDQVSVEDNFLTLGGESLLATQIVSRIAEAYAIRVSLRTVFLGTVASVADEIRSQLVAMESAR